MSTLHKGGGNRYRMKDISRKERDKLYSQIINVEKEEELLNKIKNRQKESLENFVETFRSVSRSLEPKLSETPMTRKFKDDSKEFELKIERYVDNHLEILEIETKKARKNLESKKSQMIQERNSLPWE